MKKRILAILMVTVMVLSMAACSSDNTGADDKENTENDGGNNKTDNNSDNNSDKDDNNNNNDKDNDSSNDNTPVVEGTANGNEAGFDEAELAIYNALFDLDNKISVKVTISQEEINKIQSDYKRYEKSPIYRIAEKVTFDINGEIYEIEDVGIRMKGNTSRTDLIARDGRYHLTHFRLSFDETFDETEYYGSEARVWDCEEERQARKDRTFATLSSMELKYNGTGDRTYSTEVYAHEFFINNGVLAQKCTEATFNFGETDFGVYTIYEPVDKTFIERNLPEEDWDGDLYKAQWTYVPANYSYMCSYGIEDEITRTFYNYDLKTNKKSSDHSSIRNLIDTINTKNSKESIESVVDIDYFIKFAATSYFAGCPDDVRNNYNNHYVYFKKSDGKAIFIPYDYDRCFGHTGGYNPDGQCMTSVSPFETRAVGAREGDVNQMFMQIVTESGYYVDEYVAELKRLMDSEWLTYDKFLEIYNKIETNYKDNAVPTYNFKSCDEQALAFGDNNTQGNMHVDVYLDTIKNTCASAIIALAK
ncbi:MAG: CotH kinase family protein [Lachnospiraceae bacterium]|nr:CotH kinase family protein [Lachnospiraceae bacterium]